MRVAFFGHSSFCDYYQIGGFESYVRRLALQILGHGDSVDYVLYGAPITGECCVVPHLRVRYFASLRTALQALSDSYDHIVRVYVPARDRTRYLLASQQFGQSARLHGLYLTWATSPVRRALVMMEMLLASRSGRVISVSPRQHAAFARWTNRSALILPPVPDEYYVRPEEKPQGKRITVTYLGMLTPKKMVGRVIALFSLLSGDPRFQCAIYGIHDPLNENSVGLHQHLIAQRAVEYHAGDKGRYTPDVRNRVRDVLWHTDIFVQPYTTLTSTLDTPLLLLEAMAGLCAFMTTSVGDIGMIYGTERFALCPEHFVQQARDLLESISYPELLAERRRIQLRNEKLRCRQSATGQRFRAALQMRGDRP